MSNPLRICKDCGLEALTLKDLELFVYGKNYKYGKRNLCQKCRNKQYTKYNKKRVEKKPLQYAVLSLKGRAKQRGLAFDLTPEYVKQLWNECGGICPMTGVPMLKKSYVNDPFSMSVDRLDPKKGYIKGNVRLISRWYNIARSNWGDKFVLEMCQRVIKIGNP